MDKCTSPGPNLTIAQAINANKRTFEPFVEFKLMGVPATPPATQYGKDVLQLAGIKVSKSQLVK